MGKLIRALRGSLVLEVSGPFPEQFLNLCGLERVRFWAVERPDDRSLRLHAAWTDRKLLDDLAQRSGCTITVQDRGGLPVFLGRFRKRYALLAGLALSLLCVLFLSRFVMVVEVEGNVAVPDRVILSELWRQGLRLGAYGPHLPIREMTNRAMLHLEELSWMTVNLHGIRAQVIVREQVKEPELVERDQVGDIVAEAPGLVTKIENWSGDTAVEPGDTVLPGDVLIRGSVRMDPPQYSELSPEWMPVRAIGKVEGRTWRTLTASIPLTAQVKTYTGDEKRKFSLLALGQRVNFFGKSGIPFTKYDKISRTWNLTLPGGLTLPLALEREQCRAYETVPQTMDRAAAVQMLEGRLYETLLDQLGQSGKVTSQHVSQETLGDTLYVTLTAECREELGRFVPAG